MEHQATGDCGASHEPYRLPYGQPLSAEVCVLRSHDAGALAGKSLMMAGGNNLQTLCTGYKYYIIIGSLLKAKTYNLIKHLGRHPGWPPRSQHQCPLQLPAMEQWRPLRTEQWQAVPLQLNMPHWRNRRPIHPCSPHNWAPRHRSPWPASGICCPSPRPPACDQSAWERRPGPQLPHPGVS